MNEPKRNRNADPVDEPTGPEVSDEELDQLVDGELTDAEQRDLLQRLEHSPDGWRRCALAFLEAQAWQREFLRLAAGERQLDGGASRPACWPAQCATASHASAELTPGGRQKGRSDRSRRSAWSRWSVAAVVVLAAFVLGAATQAWRTRATRSEPVGSERLVAERPPSDGERNRPPQAANLTAKTRADAPAARTDTATAVAAGGGLPTRSKRHGSTSPRTATAVRSARLVWCDSRGRRHVVRVPVVTAEESERFWREQVGSLLPPALARLLLQSGRPVRTERWVIPIPLDKGRQLVVPVEQVEVESARLVSYH